MPWLLPLSLLAAPARGEAPHALSVEEAMQRGAGVSERAQMAGATLQRARAERLRVRSELLPQLNGVASYDRTLASEFDGLFEASAADPQQGGAFDELPFGRPNTWRFGVSASQVLYAGGRIRAASRMASALQRSAELGVGSARAEAVLETARAYFDAVLADRLLDIAVATQQQAERTLQRIRLERRLGETAEFELLRAQVSVENQRPLVLQRRMDLQLAQLRLRQLLDLPPRRPLQLSTQLEGSRSELIGRAAALAAGLKAGGGERAAVGQATAAVEARLAGSRMVVAGHLPAIRLSSQLGTVAYPSDFLPGWSDFRLNWTVGVSLTLNLFAGGRFLAESRAAQADVIEARARLRLLRELADLDGSSAREQLKTARAVWQASTGVVQQADRAHQIAEVRYQAGISTQLELADARLQLQQSRVNRARAARDLQLAAIRLALLPALPLAGTAPLEMPPDAGAVPPEAVPAPAANQTGSPTRGGGP